MLRYKTAAEVPQSGITGRGVKPTPLEPQISWSGALSTVALGVQPPDPSSPSTRTMNQKQTDMNYANNSGVATREISQDVKYSERKVQSSYQKQR